MITSSLVFTASTSLPLGLVQKLSYDPQKKNKFHAVAIEAIQQFSTAYLASSLGLLASSLAYEIATGFSLLCYVTFDYAPKLQLLITDIQKLVMIILGNYALYSICGLTHGWFAMAAYTASQLLIPYFTLSSYNHAKWFDTPPLPSTKIHYQSLTNNRFQLKIEDYE